MKGLLSAIDLRVPGWQRVIQGLTRVYGLHVERRAVSFRSAKESWTCRPADTGAPRAAVPQVMSSMCRYGAHERLGARPSIEDAHDLVARRTTRRPGEWSSIRRGTSGRCSGLRNARVRSVMLVAKEDLSRGTEQAAVISPFMLPALF